MGDRRWLRALARARFGKSVLALGVRGVLDRGRPSALWRARQPDKRVRGRDIPGWDIDGAPRREIDAILNRCITDPVSPAFMAPPEKRPADMNTQAVG